MSLWFTMSLYSGPRCGLGELVLPENEPGSSIMPVWMQSSFALLSFSFSLVLIQMNFYLFLRGR